MFEYYFNASSYKSSCFSVLKVCLLPYANFIFSSLKLVYLFLTPFINSLICGYNSAPMSFQVLQSVKNVKNIIRPTE